MELRHCSFRPLQRRSVLSHAHDCSEWHYVVEGRCGFRLNGQRYVVQTGDLFVIPPDSVHGIDIAGEDEWIMQYVLTAEGDEDWQAIWGEGATGPSSPLAVRPIGTAHHATFARLQSDMQSAVRWRIRAASHRFQALLCTAMDQHGSDELVDTRHPAVDQALTIMRQRLRSRLSLRELAHAVKLDPHYLSRLFSAQVGMAPMACFVDLKMQLATALLAANDDAIATIAEALAYEDPFHFSRVFRRWSGEAPSKWRTAMRAGKTAF